jgi:hypothetical protein
MKQFWICETTLFLRLSKGAKWICVLPLMWEISSHSFVWNKSPENNKFCYIAIVVHQGQHSYIWGHATLAWTIIIIIIIIIWFRLVIANNCNCIYITFSHVIISLLLLLLYYFTLFYYYHSYCMFPYLYSMFVSPCIFLCRVLTL